MPFLATAKRILLATGIVYAGLVATHLGEFWPFSIYPMFSQAGNPWTRALVRVVPEADYGNSAERAALLGDTVGVEDLPGRPLPLKRLNVNRNDVANFVSKTSVWNEARIQNMRRLLGRGIHAESGLLVYRVRGRLTDGDGVRIRCEPLFLITRKNTFAAPAVDTPDQTAHRTR